MPSRGQPAGAPSRQRKVRRREASAARAELAAGGQSHREQRRLRSIIRTWDSAARRRKLTGKRTALALTGGVIAMVIVGAAVALWPAIDAARGQGISGTFTVSHEACVRRVGCNWVGTFQSPDGEVVPGVAYDGSLPAGAQSGASIPAIYPGSGQVYAPRGSYAWLPDLLLTVLVGAAVAAAVWISPLGRGQRETRHRPRGGRLALIITGRHGKPGPPSPG